MALTTRQLQINLRVEGRACALRFGIGNFDIGLKDVQRRAVGQCLAYFVFHIRGQRVVRNGRQLQLAGRIADFTAVLGLGVA